MEDGKWYFLYDGTGLYSKITGYPVGAMLEDCFWISDNGRAYYLGLDGAMLTGTHTIYTYFYDGIDGEHWTTLNPENAELFPDVWRSIEYTFSADGYLEDGYIYGPFSKNYHVVYGPVFFRDGKRQSGWTKQGGKWYYRDPDTGAIPSGFQDVQGKTYLFDVSGMMLTGWVKQGYLWYYLDPVSGAMVKDGWVKVDGKWYFMDRYGAMQTGDIYWYGDWYYLTSSGAMFTGWRKVSGNWCYYNTSGDKVFGGWVWYKNAWYYIKYDGVMAASETLTIKGVKYTFNAAGKWIK